MTASRSLEREPVFPQSIGECVYCGTSDEELSDEHVIPFGLHGNWILSEASCAKHRDVTSALETDALRNAWAAARAVLGIRTRRPKRRTEGFNVTLEVHGQDKVVRVSAEDHPAPLAWPIYAFPGEMPPEATRPGTSLIRVRTAIRKKKAVALMRLHGAQAVRYTIPDPTKFARFLGKIAYCFAVACSGLPATREAPLLKALLMDGPEIFKFVGNDDGSSRFTAGDEQEVAMGANENGRVVYIRLLPILQAQEYIVFVDAPLSGPTTGCSGRSAARPAAEPER